MITRRAAIGLLATASLYPASLRAGTAPEPEFLRERIAKGELPPLAERLPKEPLVLDLPAMGRETGRCGGVIHSLISGQRDIRIMTVYGYSRLVGLDETLAFKPDILRAFDVAEERIFTFHLRDGHKWSDGSPFTAEDFRYCWEDVWLNKDLTPGGFARQLLVDGKAGAFEIVDPMTVRYSWDAPNPDFLPSIAAAQALSLALPAAYMKQFHKKYQDADKLQQLVDANKAKKWTTLHLRMARQYRPENPDLPTLDPWRNRTAPPAEQFIFERNPFFHRVDQTGQQLPYLDKVVLGVSASEIIVAKTQAGESDLQALGLDFADYTLLKAAEKRYPVKVGLWKRTQTSRFALQANLNYFDEGWVKLLRDVRFRRALSLAIDRKEINLALFYGLAKESADSPLPESPLYKVQYAQAWSRFDRDGANALLDEAGLKARDDDGMRLLPDGRPAQIVVETPGESILETDVLELIADHWRNVGLSAFIRTSQRDVFRSRAVGGQIMMSLWSGADNGVPTADMNPGDMAPTSDEQLQWPVWGLNYLSNGQQGSPPDMPEANTLLDLLRAWRHATTTAERANAWDSMLALYTDQVFSIGIVNATLQPILASARLRNVPDKGLYSFNPTCYLGVYHPDAFWLADEG